MGLPDLVCSKEASPQSPRKVTVLRVASRSACFQARTKESWGTVDFLLSRCVGAGKLELSEAGVGDDKRAGPRQQGAAGQGCSAVVYNLYLLALGALDSSC